MSSSADTNCFTIVWEDASETPSTQEFRNALQKGSDEVKLDTLRRIITATLNGSPQVSFGMSAVLIACVNLILLNLSLVSFSHNC